MIFRVPRQTWSWPPFIAPDTFPSRFRLTVSRESRFDRQVQSKPPTGLVSDRVLRAETQRSDKMAMPYYTMPMMAAPTMPVPTGVTAAAPAYYSAPSMPVGSLPAPLVTGVMPPGFPIMASSEQPGTMLSAYDCARYGVPFGAVWGGAVSQSNQGGSFEAPQAEPEPQDDGAHGTQV
jgi:hypothetical protein